MAIDMSQFYQVFFEEAGEHLASMENLLLTLDVDNPDSEQLNAIFRAAHSIKGSSGTFGFTDLADVTHILENLLDRVRKGELKLRNDMIDAFLDAGDVLKNLLAAHQGEGEPDRPAAEAICQRLRRLTEDSAPVPQAASAAPPAPSSEAAVANGEPGLDLFFVLEGDPAAAESTLDNLMAELAETGTVRIVGRAATSEHPWHLQLIGAADAESVRGMLEFVARNDSIRIAPLGQDDTTVLGDAPDGAYGFFDAPVAAEPAADDSFGFFEPLPQAAAAEEAAYGFFEPLPPPAAPAVPVASVKPVADREAKRPAAPAAKPVAADTTIRVGVDKVDQLINLVGELVITQAMLAQNSKDVDPTMYQQLVAGLADLDRNTRDLQESVMSIRMIPMSVVFNRFPRMLRDLANKLGKKVDFVTQGEATELDKGLVEKITDPLTHLVRNSCDHGIELPAERIAKGKPEQGRITLSASHQGGSIVIEVRDDGRGLSREKLIKKARERGIDAPDTMPDAEVWQLIFAPGFSTADVVTDVSGRGVGMDVVKKNITALGGSVDIDSAEGYGMSVKVRLPLTLAIMDGMSVGVADEVYILPLSSVIESFQVQGQTIKTIAGSARVVQVRDEYMPVIGLEDVFQVPRFDFEHVAGIMVVVEAEGGRVALLVDELLGQQQVVVKNLESNYRRVNDVSGATIMGDGRVALILDVGSLVRRTRH